MKIHDHQHDSSAAPKITPANRKVTIAGGGTAGWMTAAALSRVFGRSLDIRLIESDKIGTIGVGEATIPSMGTFNQMLGIDEFDFLKNTQGTYKLGIEFVNWTNIGERYMHPFGELGTNIQQLPFYHYWQRMYQEGHCESLADFSLATLAAQKSKFTRPLKIENSPLANIAYAFHFDAGLYAKYLRVYAESNGVHRIEGEITAVQQDNDTGFITGLTLDDSQTIDGDLFVDCTGFKGLLIQGCLKTGYKDWTHYLPCDRAITAPCKSVKPITPYTRATAHKAGWQWRIPLQHRIGNGHIYCSDYMSDDEAASILEEHLPNKKLADPRLIRFKTGMRRRSWNKNCVAIGLSNGFLEPLESTSIHLIQTAISKLIALFPSVEFNQIDIKKYNEQLNEEFYGARDFLIAHYALNKRSDEQFWRDRQHMDIPISLKEKIELYESCGRIYRDNNELFGEQSWLALFHGQGIRARHSHPVTHATDTIQLKKSFDSIKEVIARSVDAIPDHEDFIAKYCKANPA